MKFQNMKETLKISERTEKFFEGNSVGQKIYGTVILIDIGILFSIEMAPTKCERCIFPNSLSNTMYY